MKGRRSAGAKADLWTLRLSPGPLAPSLAARPRTSNPGWWCWPSHQGVLRCAGWDDGECCHQSELLWDRSYKKNRWARWEMSNRPTDYFPWNKTSETQVFEILSMQVQTSKLPSTQGDAEQLSKNLKGQSKCASGYLEHTWQVLYWRHSASTDKRQQRVAWCIIWEILLQMNVCMWL